MYPHKKILEIIPEANGTTAEFAHPAQAGKPTRQVFELPVLCWALCDITEGALHAPVREVIGMVRPRDDGNCALSLVTQLDFATFLR